MERDKKKSLVAHKKDALRRQSAKLAAGARIETHPILKRNRMRLL